LSQEIKIISNKLQNQVTTVKSSVKSSKEEILKQVNEALNQIDLKNSEQMKDMDTRHMDKMDSIQYSVQMMTSMMHMAERRES
jgi:hypothetical protein